MLEAQIDIVNTNFTHSGCYTTAKPLFRGLDTVGDFSTYTVNWRSISSISTVIIIDIL